MISEKTFQFLNCDLTVYLVIVLVSAYDVYSHFNTSLFIFIPCYHHSGKYCFVFQSTKVPQYFAIQKKILNNTIGLRKQNKSLISVLFTDTMIGKYC